MQNTRPRPRKFAERRFSAPFREYRLTVTQDQYQAIRLSSMKMRGFKYKFERDLETDELVVYGRDDAGIHKALHGFAPDAPVKSEFSYQFQFDR